MNAPTTAAAIAEPRLVQILVQKLRPSPTHIQELRRKRFDKKALEDLADSIRKVGILQPIVATPWKKSPLLNPGDKDPTHVIVAGERRWLAAKIAGLTHVPASVRELTDEQVLEVQLIENLQREGLHELEEAEGYEELMKLKKINADALADMVGKSRSYVYARLKLLALAPEAREAFYGGKLDASRALLIARIGHHDTQRQAMKDVLEGVRHGAREPLSYREAHRHILENYMLRLKSAPFDTKDENLVPKAGACAPCPKRTGNQRDLFGDVKDADVCTDPKCFDDKRQAHFAAPRKALEAKGAKVIFGADAKKIFQDWDSPNGWARDRMTGGQYVSLDDTTYSVSPSRKVRDVLGPDYAPVLIQHPGTGQIIKVATQQALAAAAALKQRARKRSSSQASRSGSSQPVQREEDRISDLVEAAIIKAAHAKAPKALGTPELRILAQHLWATVQQACRQGSQKQLGDAWGWKIKPTYFAKPPKEIEKLAPGELPRFVIDCLVTISLDGDDLGGLLKHLKVDPKVIERQVKEQEAKKAADAKAAKKTAANASPKASPKKKPAGKKAKKK